MKTATDIATNNSLVRPPVPVSGRNLGETVLTRIVTTSWDDGDTFDLRVAELLAARRLPGTFYIPVKGHIEAGHRTCRMNLAELRDLNSQGYEIGAHGISEPNLSACDPQQLIVEVESSKKRLEDDLSKNVAMFAYPRGRHNRSVINVVKRAGFTGARTTAMLGRQLLFNPYRMPTSVQVYPHTRVDYFRNLARAWDVRRTLTYATHLRSARTWVELAKVLFEGVQSHGGIWHLYGHSWEIEEFHLWDGLREVLDYVANRPGVTYLSNGDAVQMRIRQLPCVSYAAQPTAR